MRYDNDDDDYDDFIEVVVHFMNAFFILLLAGRFLIGVFWFIVLIQMSSYTANLAAYFTFKKSFTEIQDLETLAKMDYNIIIFKHSVIHTQLKTSTYQPYQMIYEKIETHNAFVHYFEEGTTQIRNSTEKTTILLSESPFLEDLANKKPCDLVAGLMV